MTMASACAPSDSHVGNTPSHVPAQYGSSTSSGVIGSQPMPCRVRAVVPTMTSRTKASSTPVAISIRL